MPIRIKQIFAGLTQVIALEKPDTAAIEQVFMATNPDAALKLGQARGAAIAAMTALDLEVSEYTARQIKQSAAGYGAASKEQMQHMVAKLLRYDEPLSFDAADALACAICHIFRIAIETFTSLHNILQPVSKQRAEFFQIIFVGIIH